MKTLRELLTGRAPLTIAGSASALEAARRMHAEHVGCLLVLDGGRKPLGIFTERDLTTRVVVEGREPATVQVKEVMTREPFCIEADERVLRAARQMQERHVRHLPVTEGGALLGVLSLRDLLRELLEHERRQADAMREYIQGTDGSPAPLP